jgi:SAM-dependent methyltransferase
MAVESEPERKVAGDWDVYWRGTHENAAHQEGGPQDVVLAQFWNDIFQRCNVSREQQPGRLLDLACGNGAVTGFAAQAAPQLRACCVDYSLSAVLELQKRYPLAHCVAADVLCTPFANGSFDMVTSQFGIEYAGVDSVGEAARLVAPGGVLAVILHMQDGGIYRECKQNLQVIDAIGEMRLLPLTRDAFNAGFDVNEGVGSMEAFKEAEKRFTPPVRALEALLAKEGFGVAAGLAQKLYQDIAHMYRRISAYDRADIINWVDGMTGELEAYRGRMSSMMSAALDATAMQKAETLAVAQGLTLSERRSLKMGSDSEAAAWAMICHRN